MSDIGAFGEKLLAAFGWAGKHGRKARLHGVTDDFLKRGYGGDALADKLIEATDDDPALAVEMLDEIGFRRALLARYAQRRANKLRVEGWQIKPVKDQDIETSPDGDRAGQCHIDAGVRLQAVTDLPGGGADEITAPLELGLVGVAPVLAEVPRIARLVDETLDLAGCGGLPGVVVFDDGAPPIFGGVGNGVA